MTWATAIVSLLFWSRPAAVIGRVVTIVIATVKRHPLGALAHVGKEHGEVQPSFTDLDTSAAVLREIRGVRVPASLLHVVPGNPGSFSQRATVLEVGRGAPVVAEMGREIAVRLPTLVVKGAESLCVVRSSAAFVRADSPSKDVLAARAAGRAIGGGRWMPSGESARGGARGRLILHLNPILSGVMRLGVISVGAAFILLFPVPLQNAESHHNEDGRLPGVPNTPAIQRMLQTGELVHCLNQASSSYPGFRSQLDEVHAASTARIGVRHIVLGGTYESASASASAGCHVWHQGRSDNFCTGCAADVTYANAPATIRYKLNLGYVSLRTTQAHEEGHVYGEHEGYNDVAFESHILTKGFWAAPWGGATVMDVGSHLLSEFKPWGVYQLTEADYRVATQWLYPRPLPVVGSNAAYPPNVYWCGADSNATRVALIYWTAETGNYFSGQTFATSADKNNCQGVYIDRPAVGELYCALKAENEISWQYHFNEVWTRC